MTNTQATTITKWQGQPGSNCPKPADEGRYAIASVLPLKGKESSYIVSTNGRSLAVAPAEIDQSERFGPLLSPALFKGKAVAVAVQDGKAAAFDKRRQPVGSPVDVRGGTFPPCGDIVPDTHAETTWIPPCGDIVPDTHAETTWITFDAKLLLDLVKSIGDTGENPIVSIGINAINKPIAVVPFHGDGLGVLMPCQSPADLSDTFNARRKAFLAAWKD